ncbi:catalase [Loktanella fryxellensis]|uniref:Catalase n=1 Tax=Loktanella fryxellensis TaxID=245187 RepID=A0A1H7ZKG8_9RHOB|nr:catalase [Loktanella fryxellensis]SEM58880.1 catalase [Loktanella fryxellensis]
MTHDMPRRPATADTQSNRDVASRDRNPGQGGETHQHPDDGGPRLTTAQGVPVADNQNTLTAGPRGPALLEDFHFREKIFHFDHERIPERVVHARGYGAHGYFETTDAIPDLTAAHLFGAVGRRVPVFTRFSTVAGSKGSPDLARDVRGFAVKFYTEEGNWDLVGNNIPVFFVQDAMKFPDLIHAAKPEPDRGFPQAQTAHDNFWDFISLMPEAMHMIMWTMSDRAIPRSFRFMEGFGVHTFRMINADGNSSYVKFHWKPKAGLQSVLWDEAVKINGADPDFHRRDLWDAIGSGDFPEWDLGVQVFDDAFADAFGFDVLDSTKLIPEEDCPVRIIGRMVLDRRVDNMFAETEQVAFCTQNVVPGIGFTNDPLLQGRNFSYLDTQIKRLGGPNFTHIPINAPRCPMHHFQQDGHMAMHNPKGRANYEPNGWAQGGPRADPKAGYRHFAQPVEGESRKLRPESFADHYSQARQFYVSQTKIEQGHIADALIFELSKVETLAIRERMVAHLPHIDADLARTVGDGLGFDAVSTPHDPAVTPVMDLPSSAALSILRNGPDSFAGRKMGIVVTDGIDDALLEGLRKAVMAAGGVAEVVAPKVGGIVTAGGARVAADHKIDGAPSVLFDAVAILATKDGAKALAALHPARGFVADAVAHAKFIGLTADAAPLLDAAGVPRDDGMMDLDASKTIESFVAACAALRFWARLPA